MDSLGLTLFDSEIRVGPLAAWLAPEEFQNLQLNHQYQLLIRTNIYGLFRSSIEARHCAALVDALNAPKTRGDTFRKRCERGAREGWLLEPPEIVTGYKQYKHDTNCARRRQLVAEMPNVPCAELYAAAAVHALNLPPRTKPTWGWRASALREQLDDREAWKRLDWRSAQLWLDGLGEDAAAEAAVR